MEQTIFYILIFIIGTLFGSFSTLAVYRLPLHQDITHKRSYCPSCNHKLSFFDMIPILSYIFLGGKCRYCGKRIRIRYLLLEILTGSVFLLFAISINTNLNTLDISKLMYLVVGLLYMSGLIIIAGIDKEKRKINKPILVYEIVVLSLYMIYLYIVEKTNIYRYVIYLLLLLILFIIDTICLKKKEKESYIVEIIILSIIQAVFSYGYGFLITVIITLLTIALDNLIRKIVKKEKEFYKNLPIGYYLCISNMMTIIILNILAFKV